MKRPFLQEKTGIPQWRDVNHRLAGKLIVRF